MHRAGPPAGSLPWTQATANPPRTWQRAGPTVRTVGPVQASRPPSASLNAVAPPAVALALDAVLEVETGGQAPRHFLQGAAATVGAGRRGPRRHTHTQAAPAGPLFHPVPALPPCLHPGLAPRGPHHSTHPRGPRHSTHPPGPACRTGPGPACLPPQPQNPSAPPLSPLHQSRAMPRAPPAAPAGPPAAHRNGRPSVPRGPAVMHGGPRTGDNAQGEGQRGSWLGCITPP